MVASGAVTASKRGKTVKTKGKTEPKLAASRTKVRKITKANAPVISKSKSKSKSKLNSKIMDAVDAVAPDAAVPGLSDLIIEASATDAKPATSQPAAAKSVATKPAARPKALVQRVYNTIDLELSKLEQQRGVSSQDRERASRALSQMVNSLEKAIDMQREMIKSAAPRNSVKDTEALRHAEDLRREIAERLERLNAGRKPRRRAGAAE